MRPGRNLKICPANDSKRHEVEKDSFLNVQHHSSRLLNNLPRLSSSKGKKKSLSTPVSQALELEDKNLQEMVLSQLEVSNFQNAIAEKDTSMSHLEKIEEIESTKEFSVHRREQRLCLLRPNKVTSLTNYETAIHQAVVAPILATRYFGRRSKTVPSRALKRRYLGPPKNISSNILLQPVRLPAYLESASSTLGKAKKLLSKVDFLTTDSTYYVPDSYAKPQVVTSPAAIDVPSWTIKPFTSFYQMEGTENINDPVFNRRHQKFEQDERRRKRWDLQRIRELKAKEKLRKKQERQNASHQEPHSYFPHPTQIEFIEVTDQLPVMAFGHSIPLFQPSEFSLPWLSKESASPRVRKGRPPLS